MLRRKQTAKKVGLALGAFVISIYFYSLRAVKQEDIVKEIDAEIQGSIDRDKSE